MGGKEIKDAAKSIAEKKKLLRQPVPMLPDAPENIRLSKKEFLEKRRAQKNEDAQVDEYRAKLKAGKKEEVDSGVQEEEREEEVVEEVKAKKARKKKTD
jgi:hypothetical protein